MNRDTLVGWLALVGAGVGSAGIALWDPAIAATLGLWWGSLGFLCCLGLTNRVNQLRHRVELLEALEGQKVQNLKPRSFR